MLTKVLSQIGLTHGGSYEEKFDESGWRVFERALNETRNRGQNYLSLGHLLNALAIENPDVFNDVVRRSDVEPTKAREFTRESIESISKGTWRRIRIAPEVTRLLRQAQVEAQKFGRKIEAADIGQAFSRGRLEFPRIVNWKAV